MTDKREYTDVELEAYLEKIELVEPPKAMAEEIIQRVYAEKRKHREIIFLDSRLFKVLLSLSACFILLFTGTFQDIVDKSIQYNGQMETYMERQAASEGDALQKKIDRQVDKYKEKLEKGLERYEKK